MLCLFVYISHGSKPLHFQVASSHGPRYSINRASTRHIFARSMNRFDRGDAHARTHISWEEMVRQVFSLKSGHFKVCGGVVQCSGGEGMEDMFICLDRSSCTIWTGPTLVCREYV